MSGSMLTAFLPFSTRDCIHPFTASFVSMHISQPLSSLWDNIPVKKIVPFISILLFFSPSISIFDYWFLVYCMHGAGVSSSSILAFIGHRQLSTDVAGMMALFHYFILSTTFTPSFLRYFLLVLTYFSYRKHQEI